MKCFAWICIGLSLFANLMAKDDDDDEYIDPGPDYTCICDYNPGETTLCGSDGRTYESKCIFDCVVQFIANLTIIHQGPC